MLKAAPLCVLVFVLVCVSSGLTRRTGGVSVIWPANAVLLAVLLRTVRHNIAPLICIGLAGMLAAFVVVGVPVSISALLTVVNGLEVLLCLVGLNRLIGKPVDLSRPLDLVAFIVLAGALGPTMSATVALNVLAWWTDSHWLREWSKWTIAHGLGLLIVTPALLVLTPEALARLRHRPGVGINCALLMLFGGLLTSIYSQTHMMLYVLLTPMLMLLAFRMELVGAALGALMTAVAAVSSLLADHGPITMWHEDFALGAFAQQFNLLVLTATALAIGTVLAHRNRLRESLAESLAASEKARAEAVEAEKKTRLAETFAGIGFWRLEVATMKISWSPELFRIHGFEGDQPPSFDEYRSLLHPEDTARIDAQIASAFENGINCETKGRIRRPDGSWRTILGLITCERDARGKVTCLSGVSLDITHLMQADEAVRASEERYRLLAENATDIVLQSDFAGRLTYVSPSVAKLTGYRPEDLIGQSGLAYIDPKDARNVRAAAVAAFRSKHKSAPWQIEYRLRHKDGRLLWFEGRPRLLIEPTTGRCIGVTDTVRDISERKAIEAELLAARDAAEAAAEAKAEFLANMSHEIRTPLTGIIGFSGLLEERKDLPEAARLYVQRIVTSGRSLLSVVNDILDFSKLDARQVELDPHPFDAGGFIDDTIDLLGAQAANKGLTLDLEIDPSVPPIVEADSSRLRQVLLNLVNNALKFTKTGGVKVCVGYEAEGQWLRVTVADTGQGIAADKRDRLFQRFSQTDGSVSRSHGGTGLGLAICKGLVELMGGTIGVDSIESQGSTFWFTIAAPTAARVDVTPLLGEDTEEVLPVHILLVDDVAVNRELVKAMLAPFGHTFVEADGGVEAVRAALSARFDLIFMDLQMPGMDGFTAARIIRDTADLNHQTPIIALSANVLPKDLVSSKDAGMDDHLGKPIRPSDLLAKVARWGQGRALPVVDDRLAS